MGVAVTKPRVVFVEDEALLRGLLADFFTRSGMFEVCGAAEDALHGIDLIERERPDLVVMDLQLPSMSGAAVVELLLERLGRLPRVVVLSGATTPTLVRRLLRLGVRGVLQKGISAAEVLASCQRVMRGGVSLELPDSSLIEMTSAPEADGSEELTRREVQVLEMVAAGKRSKEIAALLNLSVRTVDKHRENLMRKLGVHDVAGLVRHALGRRAMEVDPSAIIGI